jgi:hypothetical protein
MTRDEADGDAAAEAAIARLFGGRTAAIVPDAIGPAAAAELRDRLERTGYTRYALLDRGSYDVLADPREPAVFAPLIEIAARATGRSLAVAEARALRLRAGDYLLAHHDRILDDHPVELILDISPASVPGAEVHYRRRGQVYFRVPCAPGSLAIVERGPTVACNHTYVSKRDPAASVVRLVVLLRDAATSRENRAPAG